MENKIKRIVIFGCGGVGSWVAEWVIRQKLSEELVIVDYDDVEKKNLERQNFILRDIGGSKISGIKNRRDNILSDDCDDVTIFNLNRKIEKVEDVAMFSNSEDIAIISTDNMKSKVVLGQYFQKKIIVNCDSNFVEIKNFLDESDNHSWDLGGGYSNAQDLTSNLFASQLIYHILSKLHRSYFRTRHKTEIKCNDYLTNEVGRRVENDE